MIKIQRVAQYIDSTGDILIINCIVLNIYYGLPTYNGGRGLHSNQTRQLAHGVRLAILTLQRVLLLMEVLVGGLLVARVNTGIVHVPKDGLATRI